MTTEQIITIVLTSSVLSSILTVFMQWVFRHLDYKLDFKKKVIDKRITAYENIDLITWKLSSIVQDGETSWSAILDSEHEFNQFIVHLTLARKDKLWLSRNLENKLSELNAFLINLQNDNVLKTEKDYNILGNSNFKKIRNFRKEIEEIHKKDFKNLDKVKSFFNEKSHSNKFYKINRKVQN